MYQRDYILDMIRRAAEAISKVIFLRKNRQLEEAMLLLHQAMKQLLGLNSKLVRALSVKDLLSLMSKTGEVDVGKTIALGDMLKAEALLLDELEDLPGAKQCRLKAVELLLTARLDCDREWVESIDGLVEDHLMHVEKAAKPKSLFALLIAFYDEKGNLAKAEDELFHYIAELRTEANGDLQELTSTLNRGIGMVERWMRLSAEELDAAGFTQEELAVTQAELKKMKQKCVVEP